jgi:hypothetical protein
VPCLFPLISKKNPYIEIIFEQVVDSYVGKNKQQSEEGKSSVLKARGQSKTHSSGNKGN